MSQATDNIRAYLMDRVAEIARGGIALSRDDDGVPTARWLVNEWMPMIESEISQARSLFANEVSVPPVRLPDMTVDGRVSVWMIGNCDNCGAPLYASNVNGLTLPVSGVQCVACMNRLR